MTDRQLDRKIRGQLAYQIQIVKADWERLPADLVRPINLWYFIHPFKVGLICLAVPFPNLDQAVIQLFVYLDRIGIPYQVNLGPIGYCLFEAKPITPPNSPIDPQAN